MNTELKNNLKSFLDRLINASQDGTIHPELFEADADTLRAAITLEADNARLREELATLQEALDLSLYNDPTIRQLQEKLAAAQATIEQKNAAIDAAAKHARPTCDELYYTLREALTLPTNLDALHEARALECERLADAEGVEEGHREWLREEAAAHRARKQATKEEGK